MKYLLPLILASLLTACGSAESPSTSPDLSNPEPTEPEPTEQLPDNISVTVRANATDYDVRLDRYSVRMPDFAAYYYDDTAAGEKLTPIEDIGEVRTYRGTIIGNNELTVTGSVDSLGVLRVRAIGDNYWQKEVDVSDLINTNADSINKNDEVSIITGEGSEIPAGNDKELYAPEPGSNFYNNLVIARFVDRVFQVKYPDETPLDSITRAESQINELDVIRGRDSGTRYRIAYGIIETPSMPEDTNNNYDYFATSQYASTRYNTRFIHWSKGHCGGGGDFLGCWKGWSATGIYLHEVGHNFGLGHSSESDFSGNAQAQGPLLGTIASRSTLIRLQEGSKLPMTVPFEYPMAPKAFKNYITVYPGESQTISPVSDDYDANGETISLKSVDSQPSMGTVTKSGDNITYQANPDAEGVESFHYTALDSGNFQSKGVIEVQVVPNGLAGHWSMDNLDETLVNNEVNPELHMTSSTDESPHPLLSSYQVDGKVGKAISHPLILRKWSEDDALANDADNRKRQPHYYDPGHKSYTAAGWFRIEELSGSKRLMDKGLYTGWQITTEENKVQVRVAHHSRVLQSMYSTLTSQESLTPDTWHHIAMVIDRNSGTLKLYINGQLDSSMPLIDNNTPIVSGAPIDIYSNQNAVLNAGQYISSDAGTKDAMDEIRVYHKALTDQEITELSN